ncbi:MULTISPECIES: GumC family protein [unclassified Mesorhizobium]|uniref:GumC family protein n=1 Tax=unclassified Mesorhizobium TaxID=325217 RepID=UPI0011266963|nr:MULTISPECIES: GNVR domain-containing protein [unclassified Mesorhizobium]MBZ9743493.1 ATPase [Mesorhizobium sp. CO1-1-4]MBZ9806172.1 ATPase [Mesorhizobium sp. ES1-6]TPL83593.1 ATPase [Mesorhizobium sp. B2-3-12]
MNRLFASQWPLATNQQANAGQEFIGLSDIAGFLRYYIGTLSACLAAALLIAWFYNSTTDPVFTASAKILIEPKLPQHLQEGGEINLSLDTAQIESQIAVLQSEKIASMVIGRLKLIEDATFNRPETPILQERFRKIKDIFVQAVGLQKSNWLNALWGHIGLGAPESIAKLTDYQKSRLSMLIFLNGLDVRRVGVSYAIDISFTSADPEGAAKIANATADAFVHEQIDTKAESAKEGGAWLEKRLQQLRAQMNEAMARAQAFRSRHDYSVGGDSSAGGGVNSEPTLEELEVTADTYRKMYESFLQAYTNSVSQQSYPVADARVITAATPPLFPSAPKPTLVLAFAGVAGLILGIGLSFARHSFDWTIRSPRQIRDNLGLECVGELAPTSKRREFGNVDEVTRHPWSRYSQGLRKVRTEISLAQTNHPVRFLGLTAVSNNRQKSSVVSNLATLYSMSGLKTLVIDADVRRSTVTTQLLGRSHAEGKECQDAFQHNVSRALGRRFDVLSSSVVDAKGLLVPRNMQAFLSQLGAEDPTADELPAYDIVIVDLPTLESGADDLIVGSVLDGVVVVAEWGKTHVDTLRELVRTLQASNTPILGVLLTKARAMTSKHRPVATKRSAFGTRQSA